ncbi:PF20097 family protein [Luteolibacter ambystomatis]|uniref:PF20097 family protein n=1 Tax=Luteolibacter ambystomatis TaxID=2824561 RepID=UPI001CF7D1F7
MKCPKCDAEMESGGFYIGYEGGGRFAASLRPRALCFKSNQWRPHALLDAVETLHGYFCDTCGLMVIQGQRKGLSSLAK